MNDTVAIDPSVLNAIANATIADLVESTPDVMTVLAPFGLDLCCGGGRPLGEALALHGIEVEPVLQQIAVLAHPTLEN
jgi:iron-sulfur cluster repair protein YtfE (RIC family)